MEFKNAMKEVNNTFARIYGEENAFKEFELENFGYEIKFTFYSDFLIADMFGVEAVKDTYRRAYEGWKNNVDAMIEVTIVLNTLCCMHYDKGNEELSKVYSDLYYDCNNACLDNFKGKDLDKYFRITD